MMLAALAASLWGCPDNDDQPPTSSGTTTTSGGGGTAPTPAAHLGQGHRQVQGAPAAAQRSVDRAQPAGRSGVRRAGPVRLRRCACHRPRRCRTLWRRHLRARSSPPPSPRLSRWIDWCSPPASAAPTPTSQDLSSAVIFKLQVNGGQLADANDASVDAVITGSVPPRASA